MATPRVLLEVLLVATGHAHSTHEVPHDRGSCVLLQEVFPEAVLSKEIHERGTHIGFTVDEFLAATDGGTSQRVRVRVGDSFIRYEQGPHRGGSAQEAAGRLAVPDT